MARDIEDERVYKPAMRNKRVLPRHRLGCDNALTPRCKPPAARPKRFIQYAPIFNLGKIDDAIGLYLDVIWIYLLEEDCGCFFREGLGAETVEGACPIDVVFAVVAVIVGAFCEV